MPNPLASTPARVPAFFMIVPFLLLGGCSLLPGQQDGEDGATATTAASAKTHPSFDLEVQAPSAIRSLLLQHMELQRFRQQSDLRRRELSRLLGAADANVRDLIGTLGYFSPTITIRMEEVPDADEDEAPRKVVVEVDPGPIARIATVELDFTGPTAAESAGLGLREQVRHDWSLRPGEAFTQSAWSGAKSQGLRTLQARRYPTASIDSSLADIDADTQEAQLSVTYAPGPAYRFGALQVQGSERYDPDGARRIARLPEGAEYKLTSLLDAQQRLANSGYYDAVFFTLDTAHGSSDADGEVTAPVIAQVREAQLQKWVFGVGVSTDTGPRLSVDHTHNRLPWLGWRAVTKLQLDRKNPLLSTRWTALPGEDGWSWFTSAKAERAPLADYDVNSLQLRAGRSKNEDRIDRQYYLQYDYARPQGVEAPSSSTALTANYGWTGRYFNNPLNPTSGFGFAWEVGGGTTLTPERTPFGRVSGRWLGLLPLGDADVRGVRQSRLAFRAEGGAVIAKAGATIPITQLFLTGGDTTVRGYRYQSIGARAENGETIGGRYMAVGSVEWQRPITVRGNRSDWEHTVFVDAGSVADTTDAMSVKVGVGTGIRWASPVGPVQADLAYGLDTKDLRLHLRLGFTF